MRWRLARLAATCLAFVAVGSFSLGAPASAADVRTCTAYGCYPQDGWGSGFGYWTQNGDRMTVCDSYADGWSIVVVASFAGGSLKYKWHTAGSGKCTDRSYGDLPEGTGFSFMTCLGKLAENNIFLDSCGTQKVATA